MNIEIKKKNQRKTATNTRKKIFARDKDVSKKLINNLNKLEDFEKSKIIASFISIKTEISTFSLNKYILDKGKKLCLPIIIPNSNILSFKEYDYKTNLIFGKYATQEPNKKNKTLLPNILLTPCLAFDLKGYRLGYGGGYYDQTFNYFEKKNHNFISIVVAYAAQKVDKIIHDNLDKKIHYILTEEELYKIK
jgi:5,10-methenyltetrahydrofolate synthetase